MGSALALGGVSEVTNLPACSLQADEPTLSATKAERQTKKKSCLLLLCTLTGLYSSFKSVSESEVKKPHDEAGADKRCGCR